MIMTKEEFKEYKSWVRIQAIKRQKEEKSIGKVLDIILDDNNG